MICAKREKEEVEVEMEGSTRDNILELCALYSYILEMFQEEGDETAVKVLIRTMHFQEMTKEQQAATIKRQKDELLNRMEGPMEEREKILNEILEEMGGCHV